MSVVPPLRTSANGSADDPEPNVVRFPSDMDDRLRLQRRIMIFGSLTDSQTEAAIQQLLTLSAMSNDAIDIYLNSDGGRYGNALSLHDMIRRKAPSMPTRILCMGEVAGMALLVLMAVEKNMRISLPNAQFRLRFSREDLDGSAGADEADLARICERLSDETGQTLPQIEADVKKGLTLDAAGALAYGLVGSISEV